MTVNMLATSLTRRQFSIGTVLGAALIALPSSGAAIASAATAQDTSDFASLGYPELSVTVTDTSFEGVPAETAAGRYLLKVTGKTEKVPQAAVGLVSPTPVGMSAADFLQFLAPPATPAGATPGAGGSPGGTPEAGGGGQGQDQQLPLVIYQMKFAGGTEAIPGQTTEAIIDLTAGEWVVWGDDPTAPQKPLVLNVTGDFPKDVKDPEATLTATLVDFAIQIEGTLTAGKHVIKVQNHGAQPHFLDIEKGPDSMTKEQVAMALMMPPDATPAAGGLSESSLSPVFYSPTQSIGTDTWHHIDLTDGTFLAACFFPTAGTGVPHALNGMIDVFKVTG